MILGVNDIEVQRALSSDWRTVKETGLRALTDSPDAFASTHAREAGFDDARWQRWVERGDWFLARRSGTVVGIVSITEDDDRSDEPHLVALWVDPGHRGTPAAASLVQAVCRRAQERGASAVTLWVADDNPRARRFYARLGFRPTGERQPLPSNPALGEHRLRLSLT